VILEQYKHFFKVALMLPQAKDEVEEKEYAVPGSGIEVTRFLDEMLGVYGERSVIYIRCGFPALLAVANH